MDGFFEAKHRYDPENRFTSRFFELYRRKFLARHVVAGS
jgi:hypothetical protein